jgi:hypothetical protein
VPMSILVIGPDLPVSDRDSPLGTLAYGTCVACARVLLSARPVISSPSPCGGARPGAQSAAEIASGPLTVIRRTPVNSEAEKVVRAADVGELGCRRAVRVVDPLGATVGLREF